MAIPAKIVEQAASEIRGVEKQYVGLIIWRIAKENCGYPTTSEAFELYKRELAQLVGRRGGDAYAKHIRQAKKEQLSLKGVK